MLDWSEDNEGRPNEQAPSTKGNTRRENVGTQNYMKENYDDIINLPHHVSKNRPQMSMYQRAAQFAPFAALTGHDKAIEQTTKENVESYENNS